jgi:hypothetical protein
MQQSVVKEFEFAAKNPFALLLKECVQRELNMSTAAGNDCTNILTEKYIKCHSIMEDMSKKRGGGIFNALKHIIDWFIDNRKGNDNVGRWGVPKV